MSALPLEMGASLPLIGGALLLGLRHAGDPDHVTAVATLALSGRQRSVHEALVLGLAWGLGHAATFVLAGAPVALVGSRLPDGVRRAAELAVGVLLVLLAVRLLVRWCRGEIHLHAHAHGRRWHSHPHFHDAGHDAGRHGHAHRHERSALAAFAIGLVHGTGGSAAAGLLVVAADERARGALGVLLALSWFALGTALAMTAASAVLGLALARGPCVRWLERAVPALAVLGVLLGCWYAYTGCTGTHLS
jgi:ABC-type nickel/cobalt efflux system permease component RcnA